MPCHRGDVVLVPFPFSDAATTKKRPAIVLTTDRFNAGNLDVLVCGITHSPQAVHRAGAVRLTDLERKAGGLDADPLMTISVAVASKLATIAQVRVATILGRLPKETVDRILDALTDVVRDTPRP